MYISIFFFFKQKTAYEMRISDWSSDVCSSDLNPGDTAAETRFKEINEAYEVLKDANKRAPYDRFGHDAFANGAAAAGGSGFGGFSPGGFADIFDELFGDLMGGRRGGPPARGADLRYHLDITHRPEERRVGKGGVRT